MAIVLRGPGKGLHRLGGGANFPAPCTGHPSGDESPLRSSLAIGEGMKLRFVVLMVGVSLAFGVRFLQSGASSAASPSEKATLPDLCRFDRLSVTVSSGSAAGGTEGMLIAFRNDSSTVCGLQGYPKVVAARPGASSTAIASTSTYLGGLAPYATAPLVRLKPGNVASVVVAAGDNPQVMSSACVHQRYKTVTVSLPGQTGFKKLSAELPREATSLPSCSRVEVTPFQGGLTWFDN